MTSSRFSPLSAVVTAVASLALIAGLAGCATTAQTSPPSTTTPSTSVPSTSVPSPTTDPTAPSVAWLTPDSLVIGPRTCEATATTVKSGDQHITVTLNTTSTVDCDATKNRRGVYVPLVEGIDSTKPLTITIVDGQGAKHENKLAGLVDPPTAPTPSPADLNNAVTWLDAQTIAVLTWGSSTCFPVGGTATVEAGKPVSLELEEVLNRACTDDLGPQITLIDAKDVPHDSTFTIPSVNPQDIAELEFKPTVVPES